MKLFSGTINQLERGLSYSAIKQKVIADNVANVDTPGYKSKDVNFKTVLQDEMKMTSSKSQSSDPRHFALDLAEGSVKIQKRNFSYRENGNGVDMDREMANLATNQIYHDALIERISGKFGSLNTVIRGGQ
ncbi:flagellar basal body rod protein FlgB [Jeotgalibacillus campisalis]|uniref:Flagellar basal body rod protein FlgB n=1 Tax=Jeotgalibacillus campisalis TaxID=220754 RepID=A0A0C2VTE9_9BACL|nr:flagellar basal body rod protein FlgB [Jeotgalibacillus campisalis]KIL47711.1 flagellar basal body rod protein FlgB [Jeotgalibacillus campisalis]